MRKFLIAIALMIGVMFVIGHFAELQAIAETFRRGDLRFIGLAIVVEAAWLLNLAATFRAVYRALGVQEDLRNLLWVVTAANFVNVVAPSGGMGGVAVLIAESRRRGYSSARATVASVLFVAFDYAGFLVVLTLGLFVLFRRNNLNVSEIIASMILVGIALVLIVLMYLGMHSADQLATVLAWMARQVNRILRPFIHRDYLSESRAHTFAHDASEGLRELRQHPDNLLLPAALSLSNKALLISVLFFMFMAFQVPFSPGTLIASFSIGYLFTIVSPTPAGIGVVEGVLTLALTSMFVPLGAAAVITLAYRGVTFWLPLIFGMVAFRHLAREQSVSTVP